MNVDIQTKRKSVATNYTWMGLTIFVSILVGWRVVGTVLTEGIEPVLKDPLGILLLLITVIIVAVTQVHYSKLNKRKKQI